MKLLFEPPELPPSAWTDVFEPSRDTELAPWTSARLGPKPRLISKLETQTARGWSLTFQTYQVEAALVVVAIYQFFDLAAAIAIGGLALDWLTHHDLEVAAALRAVEPDWVSDDPLAMSELWTAS